MSAFRFLITEPNGDRWALMCTGWPTQAEALAATRQSERGCTVEPLHGIAGCFGQLSAAWLNR